MSDENTFASRPATFPGERSPRTRLWAELEELYEALEMPPPTETLTIEELEERITALRQRREQRSNTPT